MPAPEREARVAEWTRTMREHWRAEGEELVNDGSGAYATTEKDYGDFELLLVSYRAAGRQLELGILPPGAWVRTDSESTLPTSL